jgi:hypothetical protein
VEFLNWSKGLTVKEKILLHLLNFNQHATVSDVPEAVTQQGIATTISAPRPHVSIALKDLRTQKLILDKMSHIIHGKRRQKVYFLTASGIQFTNNLNHRLKETIIKVNSSTGEKQQKIKDVILEQKLSLLEILPRISTEGILDLTKLEPKRVAPFKQIDKGLSQEIPPYRMGNEPSSAAQRPGKRLDADLSQKTKQDEVYHDPYYETYQPRTKSMGQIGKYPGDERNYRDYYDYWDNYYRYYQYYYQYPPTYQISEKANKILFVMGYIFFIFGAIIGIYYFAVENPLIIIPLILFITCGVSLIFFSGMGLWQFEIWCKQMLNLMSITCPIILYLFLYSAIQTIVNLYDIALWLIIIFSFFGLAYFGSFIPIDNRIKALSILGLILVINVPVIFLFNYLDIFQSGFWLMIGVICVYLGYTLITELEHEDDQEHKSEHEHKHQHEQYKSLYMGIVIGTSLGIITASIVITLLLDVSTLTGLKFSVYGILILWLITGIYLFAQGISKSGENAEIIISSLKLAVPLYVGIILIFFGLYLLQFEKIIETLIELFLGGIVIFYTLTRFKTQDGQDYKTIALTSCALIISLVFIYIF